MPQKVKKSTAQNKIQVEEDDGQVSQASSNMEDDMEQPVTATGQSRDDNLSLILKELREFRKDSSQQLNGIKEDINKIYKRMEEAEDRINNAEERIQSSEDVLSELVKLHTQTAAKLTDLEGRTRRENVRIHGVIEGAESDSPSVIAFVEDLLMKGLELPSTAVLNIERAYRALASKPPKDAPPRSFVVKFSSYRMKEDIIKRAWQKRGFDFQGKRVQLDHDYAPELQRKRREYAEAKAVLKGKNIKFQTPYPARMRVFYQDGTVVYGSAQEATEDMAERGLPVTVLKKPTSLLDQISQMTWQTSGRRGNRENASTARGYKERLQAFRRQDIMDK